MPAFCSRASATASPPACPAPPSQGRGPAARRGPRCACTPARTTAAWSAWSDRVECMCEASAWGLCMECTCEASAWSPRMERAHDARARSKGAQFQTDPQQAWLASGSSKRAGSRRAQGKGGRAGRGRGRERDSACRRTCRIYSASSQSNGLSAGRSRAMVMDRWSEERQGTHRRQRKCRRCPLPASSSSLPADPGLAHVALPPFPACP